MSYFDQMQVDVPEGQHGRVRIERFTVTGKEPGLISFALHGRGIPPGTYTRLMRGDSLWMSDTPEERYDHSSAAYSIQKRGGRVLIGGLGLGMVLRVALLAENAAHVDVVEIDQDVIALVGPHYMSMAAAQGKTLEIHQCDLFEKRWPTGTRWETAWFDVWQDLCTDNLDSMAKLNRSYSKRCAWKGCWGESLLRYRKRQEDRQMAVWR